MVEKTTVTCSDCGKVLNNDLMLSTGRLQVCPNCGSNKLTIHQEFEEAARLNIRETLEGKLKDTKRTGKGKLRKAFFSGDDFHRKSSKWYQKERIIDKDNDTYWETVTDPETGEVIYQCEERLNEHKGHGSAKWKKNS